VWKIKDFAWPNGLVSLGEEYPVGVCKTLSGDGSKIQRKNLKEV